MCTVQYCNLTVRKYITYSSRCDACRQAKLSGTLPDAVRRTNIPRVHSYAARLVKWMICAVQKDSAGKGCEKGFPEPCEDPHMYIMALFFTKKDSLVRRWAQPSQCKVLPLHHSDPQMPRPRFALRRRRSIALVIVQ